MQDFIVYVKEKDTGETFTVILEDCSRKDAEAFITKIKENESEFFEVSLGEPLQVIS
jgi:hypothetical protein